MLKGNRERKNLNWTVISIATIVVVVLVLLVGYDNFSVFNQDERAGAEDQEATSSETEEEQKVKDEYVKAGEDHPEIQQFVAEMHDFYNETTGYGKIERLDWEEQINQAEQIAQTVEEKTNELTSNVLKEDLNQIVRLSEHVINEQEADQVRQLHRYFHDLDIAINNYSEYDQIWNVTETLTTN